MNKFNGYKVETSSAAKIEKILERAKENISLAAKEEYHRFLSEEISILCDNIALGICQRPNVSLLNAGIDILNQKIALAETRGLDTEYNLCSAVSIIPDGKSTFLIFESRNVLVEAAFSHTKGIEDYSFSLDDKEMDVTQQERSKKWTQLESKYKNKPILLKSALTTPVTIDTSMLVFCNKSERAEALARYQVMNRCIQQYSCGADIKPHELMRYFDLALIKTVTEQGELDIAESAAKLITILADIDLELIERDPNAPIPVGDKDVVGEDEEDDNENILPESEDLDSV